MARKKSQKKTGGSYSGSRMKKDNSYGDKKKKTYMILSTAAIIIGLILTGWQSMAKNRSNVDLAYSDISTIIRELKEPVTAYASSASKEEGVSEGSVSNVTKAYETLANAGIAPERGAAEKELEDALAALFEEADAGGLERSDYSSARKAVTDSMDHLAEAVKDYNAKAEAYNKAVTGFPTRLMAFIMQYGTAELIAA